MQHLFVPVVALAFLAEHEYKIIELHLSKEGCFSPCCVRKIQVLMDDAMYFHMEQKMSASENVKDDCF